MDKSRTDLLRRRSLADVERSVGPSWRTKIWPRIQRAVATSIVSVGHGLRCVPSPSLTHGQAPRQDRCFQIFGVDVVLSADERIPYVMGHTPTVHCTHYTALYRTTLHRTTLRSLHFTHCTRYTHYTALLRYTV